MKEIWLYGAGDMGKKIFKVLHDFEIEVSGFIESKTPEFNKSIYGKPVISYKEYIQLYKNQNYIIVTPSNLMIQEGIRKRLLEDGVTRDNIITKEYVIRTYWKPSKDIYQDFEIGSTRNWIIDTGEWGSFGGVEKYTYNLTRLLKKEGEKAYVIFPSSIELVPKDVRDSLINYNFFVEDGAEVSSSIYFSNMKYYSSIDFCERLKDAIHILGKYLPFTLILRGSSLWYVAAAIIKDRFPNDVTILDVVHGNESSARYEVNAIKEDLKAVICSNSGIKKKFEAEGMESISEKLIVKWHPITPIKESNTKRSNSGKVRLGYAGRLDIHDKRSDLMLEFIDELESYNVEYEFYIAGIGPFEEELRRYIQDNGYGEKVKLLGKIPYDEIHDFWNSVDIFLNFSDTEGFCLSMIEALQSGKACITTRVHEDIEQFVVSEKNGYVVDIGDMKTMAWKAAELIMNPKVIEEYGKQSVKIINEMDDGKEYIQMLKML